MGKCAKKRLISCAMAKQLKLRAKSLPDPAGTGKRYAFPNTTFLKYGGDGKFSFEADYYNPADAERVFAEWLTDGGKRDTPQDRSLRGITRSG